MPAGITVNDMKPGLTIARTLGAFFADYVLDADDIAAGATWFNFSQCESSLYWRISVHEYMSDI